MDVVENFEFKSRGDGKYKELVDAFLAHPHGTVLRFSKGSDFNVEPQKFVLSLRSAVWSRGLRSKINVKGDTVYATVIGPREDKDRSDK